MKKVKSSSAMKIAHSIKSCFTSFSEALKAAWMWVKSGKTAEFNLCTAVIAYYCNRFERAKREADFAAKKAKTAKKAASKNTVVAIKNNAALKANQEKMKSLRNPANKKIKHGACDPFYSTNREWTDYEMDVYL